MKAITVLMCVVLSLGLATLAQAGADNKGPKVGFVPPGLGKGLATVETSAGAEVGATVVYMDTALDPGPSGKAIWLRAQKADSGLQPVWAGKGSWLPAPMKVKRKMNGKEVGFERNEDKGMYEGKPYSQLWLKTSWQVGDTEYQVHAINITEDELLQFMGSITQ